MTSDPSQTCRSMARFLRQEDGQITVFTLIVFFLMVAFSGMAVDMMRHENARTDLQQTLDRAILAGASMKQVREPDVVVTDYFTKAGMTDYLDEVKFASDLDSSEVFVTALVPVKTFFMSLMNVDSLDAVAVGKAEEGVSNIEISLVLDISGSMRNGNQIGKLRVAAKSFFNQILTTDAKKTTSINVIPYAGHVNVGPFLFEELGGVRTHNNSSCLELSVTDYTNADKPASGLPQVPHFMNWAIDTATMDWGWCPKDNSAIIVAQNDKAKLDAFIDGIRLHDGTGTMSGMKYGLMLLNPAMKPVFKKMADAKVIAEGFAERPMPWATSVGADVQKYLIVMTDGQITEQRRPKAVGFKEGGNGIDDEVVYGKSDPDKVDGTDFDYWNSTIEMQKQGSKTGASSNEVSSAATNIARFTAQCNLAKQNGVIIFSIAFNVTNTDVKNQMRTCASSTSYYYDVPSSDDGSAINGAFSSIALTIKQLRLTQ